MINIGERLKYIRETYDVSQKELASILGVSHYCISHYERNDYIPIFDTFRKKEFYKRR